MKQSPKVSRSARLAELFCRIRRFLGARQHESLEEAARRVLTTFPAWSPAQDVAQIVLQARDPWAALEKAVKKARPKLVPAPKRRCKKPDGDLR